MPENNLKLMEPGNHKIPFYNNISIKQRSLVFQGDVVNLITGTTLVYQSDLVELMNIGKYLFSTLSRKIFRTCLIQYFTFANIIGRVGIALVFQLIPHEKGLVTLVEFKIWSLLTFHPLYCNRCVHHSSRTRRTLQRRLEDLRGFQDESIS